MLSIDISMELESKETILEWLVAWLVGLYGTSSSPLRIYRFLVPILVLISDQAPEKGQK